MRTRTLWPIGLVLAALFLGHDLFMAGNAHAAAIPADHHAMPAEHMTSTSGTMCGEFPATAHGAADCGSLRPAMPQTDNGVQGVAAPLERADVGLAGNSSISPVRSGPIWPPGVLRAFLQVWRI